MEESQEPKPIKAIDNRQPNGKFGPGNNANPAGRPKGQSLKEYWRQRFADMTDEEKMAFTKKVSPDMIWKMAEGNPKNDLELNAKVNIANVLMDIENGNTSNEVIGQIVADTAVIQDTGQEEKPVDLPQEQSPAALPQEQVVEKYNPQE